MSERICIPKLKSKGRFEEMHLKEFSPAMQVPSASNELHALTLYGNVSNNSKNSTTCTVFNKVVAYITYCNSIYQCYSPALNIILMSDAAFTLLNHRYVTH